MPTISADPCAQQYSGLGLSILLFLNSERGILLSLYFTTSHPSHVGGLELWQKLPLDQVPILDPVSSGSQGEMVSKSVTAHSAETESMASNDQ